MKRYQVLEQTGRISGNVLGFQTNALICQAFRPYLLLMTNEFLYLRIVRITPETGPAAQPETLSYFLEPVDGQPVTYQAGQFLTLLITYNNHEVRRSYSLSSLPGEALRLTIKRVQNGEISRYLHDTLRVGDILTSLYPAGRFTLDDKQPEMLYCWAPEVA